jgi:Tfp pilus assembly PilM family ATPase
MSLLATWLASPPPDAAIEIAPGRVSAAVLTSRGDTAMIPAHAEEPIPPGAVVASLTSSNIADRGVVSAAVRTVLGRLGTRPARVALVIPDLAAKVSLIRFDKIPARRDDLDQLVRWQLRKSAPFPIDDACVTYSRGARGSDDGSGEYIAVLAKRDVVKEYEDVCAAAGTYAGLVDLTTLSVVNLFLAAGRAPAGDWLAVYMRPEYTSIAIMRGEDMIFFRNRPEGDEESLADIVHQTAMYYEDRLAGGGFVRTLLGGSGRLPDAVDLARNSLEERLATTVEQIDPTAIARVGDKISPSADLMDVLAPLSGILLRTHRQGAAV